ncbi:MAG: GxxExxY protein [bacterium]|nr:GxxExxY protein [bacterium]
MMSKRIQEPTQYEDEIARRIIGAAIEVHRALGAGYLEAVYEKALAVEFEVQGIQYAQQYPVSVLYRGQNVGTGFLDFFVEQCAVVELKAVEDLLPVHTAQVISYLKATETRLGLLVNFNVPVLKQGIKRVVLS